MYSFMQGARLDAREPKVQLMRLLMGTLMNWRTRVFLHRIRNVEGANVAQLRHLTRKVRVTRANYSSTK
jgi:hypothetical protein